MPVIHTAALHLTAFVAYVVKTFGYLGIGVIVFAESGLLLGFILPGDSLIFLAGFLASLKYFNVVTLILVIFVMAVAGDNLGYLIGRKLGHKVFKREHSLIFNPHYLEKTEAFFEHYGKITFLIQRFIPIIRAFAPLLGGVGKMRYRIFFAFDLIGCAVWSAGVALLGFFLGKLVPNADSYLLPLILIIVALSLIPTTITYKKRKRL
ncbi:VTT domain-containing protein [Patescibacteria group bacterium]|nr:VTT domain-containing protein [Patescibacteria group bacterium]